MKKAKEENPMEKLYHSPIYRKKMKRMIQRVKALYPALKSVPNELPKLMENTDKKKKEAQARIASKRLTKSTIHYFAQTIVVEDSRRSSEKNSDGNKGLTDSLKY